MAEKNNKMPASGEFEKLLSRQLEDIEKKRRGLEEKLLGENDFLKKELSRLRAELNDRTATVVNPEGKSEINRLIREKAVQALSKFQKEYEIRKKCLEEEMSAAIATLKKEKELFNIQKQEIEKEKSDFQKFMENEKREIGKIKDGLSAQIQSQERAHWEKLFKEKEKLLKSQEKEYLEALIKSLETES